MSSTDRSAMKQHPIAKLPDLARQTIFKFLEYDDLLNLKVFCGELAGPITSFLQSKTVVIGLEGKCYGQSAFSNDYLVGKSLTSFRMNDDMHLAIKDLVLYNPPVLFNLTSFDNLIELTIESTEDFSRKNRMTISLQSLKEFEANFESDNFDIVLETPKLSDFRTDSALSHFNIIHPRSIQKLVCRRLEEVIKQMINLVTLNVYNFSVGDAGNLLSDLKQLKKFYFFVREDPADDTSEHLRPALLANPNLRIFWKRIDFNANPLQDADLAETSDHCLDDQSVQIYQKYIDAVKRTLNHDELEIRDFESLSVELIRKITYLENVQVLGAITDAEKWVELLKLESLNDLTINSAVEEHHLDLIPEHCPTLAFLEIDPFEAGDWVLRLKFLKEFKTGALFDFGLFRKMLQQLYYLRAVQASERYEIKIEDSLVECIMDGGVVLREPKAVFLQLIESVKFWSALFSFE